MQCEYQKTVGFGYVPHSQDTVIFQFTIGLEVPYTDSMAAEAESNLTKYYYKWYD